MRNMFSKLQDSAFKLCFTSKTVVGDERGQDLIEYAVLCALVAGLLIAVMPTLSTLINGAFTNMGTAANAAIDAA